jgi:hypothetical protein
MPIAYSKLFNINSYRVHDGVNKITLEIRNHIRLLTVIHSTTSSSTYVVERRALITE